MLKNANIRRFFRCYYYYKNRKKRFKLSKTENSIFSLKSIYEILRTTEWMFHNQNYLVIKSKSEKIF